MYKSLSVFLAVVSMALVGCSDHDVFDSPVSQADQVKIRENAEKIFGKIDPAQNWNSVTKGTVSVTADAVLDDIVKVQILTESPFLNPEARVLNEVKVTKGQTVQLNFDAPNVYTRLIAACVSSKGVYFTKGFNIGEQNVSFERSAKKAARKAPSASYGFPALTDITLDIAQSSPSFSAVRNIKANEGETANSIDLWKGKGWENERLWRVANKSLSGDWQINPNSNDATLSDGIRRKIEGGMTDEDRLELLDVFNTFLFDDLSQSQRKNNVALIRNSERFKLLNNHIVTTNGDPLIITPVQTFSTELKYCELYYYYFNPDDVKDMNEVQVKQYLKNLPKFKALRCKENITDDNTEFFRNYEYLLPYFGDGQILEKETLSDYTTDGKVYRIRNGYEKDGVKHYISYENNEKNRLIAYIADDDVSGDVETQLWQKFEKADGSVYLYNIGARAFLYYKDVYDNKGIIDWKPYWTPDNYLLPDEAPFIYEDNKLKRSTNPDLCLGTDQTLSSNSNDGIWTDKSAEDETGKWYFDEYDGNFDYSKSVLPTLERATTTTIVAKDYAIPAGYRVGFMLQKNMSYERAWKSYYYKWHDAGTYTASNNGECWGDGRLNEEINQFPGHFNKGQGEGMMQPDDPRIAIFDANGKSYVCFEDGIDCNYNDMIIELTNGAELTDEPLQVEAEAYFMCFEDRPENADYDMNDLVLRATRLSETQIQVSIIALGGHDAVKIVGLPEGATLASKELHELFGEQAGENFINTEKGADYREPVSEVYNVDKNVSIVDFLKNISLKNETTNMTISLPETGEPPYAIIIPQSFRYPLERVSIVTAYPTFKQWAQDINQATDWYKNFLEDKVYPDVFDAE